MTRLLCNGGAALALLVSLVGLIAPDETHGAKPAAAGEPLPPHARAPRSVKMTVDGPDRQLAWANEIEARAGREAGRFSKNADDRWVDSKGVYEWDDDNEVYWQTVPADVLTRGRQDFVQFCASCHGLEGDGYGRSAQALRPPPRSFQQSTFKFTKVYGDLPNDEALLALVKHGLGGTPMHPWAISDERLREIIFYVKSLSPPDEGWHDGALVIGGEVYTPDDPYVGKEAQAIADGEKAYHQRQCWTCHPSYQGASKLNETRGEKPETKYGADLHWGKLKTESSYEVLGYQVAIPAPDFTWSTLRYSDDARQTFQTIAAGIPGAGMPTWGRQDEKGTGSVPEQEIWAIAHYVRHLVDTYKDKPAERMAFMAGVRGQ